jgi:hypothetical protein
MNQLLIDDYTSKYDKVELTIVNEEVKYITCTNFYPLKTKLSHILEDFEMQFGQIIYTKENIEVSKKIKNY